MQQHPQRPVDLENFFVSILADGQISVNSTRFAEVKRKLELSDAAECEVKEYHDCKYFSYKKAGISFCFDKHGNEFLLAAIHFYNQGNKNKYQPFKACSLLPYNMASNAVLQDIVEKFSPEEPEKGGGARTGINIWIKYPRHGIMFEFMSKSWDNPMASWIELTLFAPCQE